MITSISNKIHPKKLLNSKWNAVIPKNKEKHFIVTKVIYDEYDLPEAYLLTAVYSGQEYWLAWRLLKNRTNWLIG